MATTTTLQIPAQVPMVTDTKQVSREWLRYFQLLTPQASSGAGSVTSVGATAPIASSGGTTPVLSLNDTAVTPGTYGDTTHVGQFTVDQKGRLTFAADVAIAFPAAAADYVVMSNGATPPSPMDDGAGNFIYTTYTP